MLHIDANTADSGRSASTRKTTTRLQVQKEEISGRGGSRKKPKDKGAVLTFTLREQDAMDDLSILRRVCFSFKNTLTKLHSNFFYPILILLGLGSRATIQSPAKKKILTLKPLLFH